MSFFRWLNITGIYDLKRFLNIDRMVISDNFLER